MVQHTTVQFLKDLKKHNNKEWFDKNRSRYDNAKIDFENLTGEILKKFSRIDESIAHLQAKECTFRINRDVRFSKDKSPYKSHMAMYMSKGGKKGYSPGYYFHFQPGNSYVAAGIWQPMPPELKKARQEIDYNWEDFKKIVGSKKIRSAFGDLERNTEILLSSPLKGLSRPPKGYDKSNPAIEYLKLKSWIVSAKISDTDLASKDLLKKIISYFETAKPLVDFFNQAVDE